MIRISLAKFPGPQFWFLSSSGTRWNVLGRHIWYKLLAMGTLDAIPLLELFLKFKYQRRVAARHPFGDEAAEVLRLGPLIQQSISHKLDQRAQLLVSQSHWGDQQRVEALEDWINWAPEDHQIGSNASIEGIIVAS